MVGYCEHSNDPLSYTKGREFVDQLNKYQLCKDNDPLRFIKGR